MRGTVMPPPTRQLEFRFGVGGRCELARAEVVRVEEEYPAVREVQLTRALAPALLEAAGSAPMRRRSGANSGGTGSREEALFGAQPAANDSGIARVRILVRNPGHGGRYCCGDDRPASDKQLW
jgi:hypothetical protein